MAVTVKENANPEIMLEEPKDILKEQFQLLKHLGTGNTQLQQKQEIVEN